MKKISIITIAVLLNLIGYAQHAELRYKGLLQENTAYISAAGKGIAYVPQLTGVLNKHSLSIGPVFQQGKVFDNTQTAVLTGIYSSYKYRLSLIDNFSELFTEFSFAYRNAAGTYEFASELALLDISTPPLHYNVLESYVGFGIRSSLKNLISWHASIGGGYVYSNPLTEYTIDGTPYLYNINDISLVLKAGIGIRLFPKNNVHYKIIPYENNLHNLRHSLYQ